MFCLFIVFEDLFCLRCEFVVFCKNFRRNFYGTMFSLVLVPCHRFRVFQRPQQPQVASREAAEWTAHLVEVRHAATKQTSSRSHDFLECFFFEMINSWKVLWDEHVPLFQPFFRFCSQKTSWTCWRFALPQVGAHYGDCMLWAAAALPKVRCRLELSCKALELCRFLTKHCSTVDSKWFEGDDLSIVLFAKLRCFHTASVRILHKFLEA